MGSFSFSPHIPNDLLFLSLISAVNTRADQELVTGDAQQGRDGGRRWTER